MLRNQIFSGSNIDARCMCSLHSFIIDFESHEYEYEMFSLRILLYSSYTINK